MKRDPDSHTSSRSLTHLAGNLKHKPATRNDHTAQPETEPALNRIVLKPLALGHPGCTSGMQFLWLAYEEWVVDPSGEVNPVIAGVGGTEG